MRVRRSGAGSPTAGRTRAARSPGPVAGSDDDHATTVIRQGRARPGPSVGCARSRLCRVPAPNRSRPAQRRVQSNAAGTADRMRPAGIVDDHHDRRNRTRRAQCQPSDRATADTHRRSGPATTPAPLRLGDRNRFRGSSGDRADLDMTRTAGERLVRRPTGGATPSSTRSTRARSPTPTATASATCPASPPGSTHLAELGVDAVWLSPFYTSPQADAGYDVADYRDVDPLFGTLADFDALLARGARAAASG